MYRGGVVLMDVAAIIGFLGGVAYGWTVSRLGWHIGEARWWVGLAAYATVYLTLRFALEAVM